MENIDSIVVSILFGVPVVLLFFIAYRQHKEKGFIFTNAWLYASSKERENMDERIKKREYRVGRNVFFMLGVLLSLLAVSLSFEISWLYFPMGFLAGSLIYYAIIQHITGERLRKSIEEEKSNREN